MPRRNVIAIGGSLGSVDAMKQLCRGLPRDVAASIAIVIHVGARGNDLLADIFDATSAIPVSTAIDGERFHSGRAYVAPADHHLLILDGVMRLGRGPRENLARPAIDPLFRSVGLSYGSQAIAVVLTGMLNDGAAGLADLKRCGGIAVVQNPADAEAMEMPLEALRGAAVDYRAPLRDLPALLATLVGQEAGPPQPVPQDIQLEVEIALGRRCDAATTALLGDPVPLSCPACGGVMSQIRGTPLRFRCQVGHAYTAQVLEQRSEGSVDEAMRVALRILEERVTLVEKMAEEARQLGRLAGAEASGRRAQEYRAHADALRQAILG